MNKVILGLLLGGILGIFDGLTAWFTPEVRAGIVMIVVGSTIKGIIAGVIAGWFARKVNNVAAGIAVGLAAGALLAYGVVAAQGGKYFWEIMLPGSLVGAICGWATQRYGVVSKTRSAGAIAAILLVAGLHAHAAEPTPFERLKSLAGTWTGHAMTPDGPPVSIVYRVSAGGTTVQETLFPGDPHEMITMYNVDGKDLIATHYCSAGNQPTMKLDVEKSTADKLVFDFVSVRGKGPYIHDGWIQFTGPDAIAASWNGNDGGKHVFYLTRGK